MARCKRSCKKRLSVYCIHDCPNRKKYVKEIDKPRQKKVIGQISDAVMRWRRKDER